MVDDAGASILTGRRLGAYQVLARLGSGGMGEVYRAHDTRLGRDVAIKILPGLFTRDVDRLARFEREARMLAALNHPNIGAIFGLEDHDGIRALVLELVDGETLANRIARGTLPPNDALRIARQIADALDAAHDKGIVHRDLKPRNVALTRDGTVKVLDFGLAKAVAGPSAGEDNPDAPTISASGTREGVVVGTAAYMSPEQARGQAVDKRTDIWAFGCVLYEMLTGRAAFSGQTMSDTIAAVLECEPEWQRLPSGTPSTIRRLMRRCLDKNPKRRVRDIGDVALDIDDVLAGTDAPARPVQEPWWRSRMAGLFGLVAVAILVAVLGRQETPGPTPGTITGPPTRYVEMLPPGQRLDSRANASRVRSLVPSLALSPDGRYLAYVARSDSGGTQLYLRALDELEGSAIEGGNGAYGPFFSPDGRWLGFFQDGALRRASVDNKTIVTITSTPAGGFGATWRWGDTIVFTPGIGSGLMRVSASGGAPEPLTVPDLAKGEIGHNAPHGLPNGKGVLFDLQSSAGVQVAVLSLETGQWHPLAPGIGGRYLPDGQVIYSREGSIWAVPFDTETLELTGAPRPVLSGVRSLSGGRGDYAVSDSGLLMYLAGSASSGARLVWVDRRGERTQLPIEPDNYSSPRLSPDGRQLAITVTLGALPVLAFVAVADLASGRNIRLSVEGSINNFGIWTPDGRRVTFNSTRTASGIYSKRADGSEQAELLVTRRSGGPRIPAEWSPDGRSLLFVEVDPTTAEDIWILPRDREPAPLVKTPFRETSPTLSPDGQWLAYTTNESGRDEVYVQPYPARDSRRIVSGGGGAAPRWSPDGGELFYVDPRDRLMSVPFQAGAPAEPVPLFPVTSGQVVFGFPNYDVASGGRRFLVVEPLEQTQPDRMYAVLNWHEELNRLVPTK